MKTLSVVVGFCVCLLICSCSSLREFRNPVKEETLYGMIIDENNNPVSDFKLVCKDNKSFSKSAVTNSSGIFTIENISTGDILISGNRDGYVELKNEAVEFMGTNKVYCWQINSYQGTLELVERNILAGNYEQALERLNDLRLNPESEEEKLKNELIMKISRKKMEKGEKRNDEGLEV